MPAKTRSTQNNPSNDYDSEEPSSPAITSPRRGQYERLPHGVLAEIYQVIQKLEGGIFYLQKHGPNFIDKKSLIYGAAGTPFNKKVKSHLYHLKRIVKNNDQFNKLLQETLRKKELAEATLHQDPRNTGKTPKSSPVSERKKGVSFTPASIPADLPVVTKEFNTMSVSKNDEDYDESKSQI